MLYAWRDEQGLDDRMTKEADSAAHAALPSFPVEIATPDIGPWLAGNSGIPGVWRFAAAASGSSVVITALVHGNEIAGAAALDYLLRANPRPQRGELILVFANLEAFFRFDPAQPTASRFIDEDFNRIWDPAVLDGPRLSSELARARQIRAVIDRADLLLDLHSMLWPGDPLILCGSARRGRAVAMALGSPSLIVADDGHANGRRLIDYTPFTESGSGATAVLVEAGQHWRQSTVDSMLATITHLLRHAGLGWVPSTPVPEEKHRRCAEVTKAVTVQSGRFSFTQPFRGGDIVPYRDTLIATDGAAEIRTPHDQCLLVMPSLLPSRGHTAVRLAQLIPAEEFC